RLDRTSFLLLLLYFWSGRLHASEPLSVSRALASTNARETASRMNAAIDTPDAAAIARVSANNRADPRKRYACIATSALLAITDIPRCRDTQKRRHEISQSLYPFTVSNRQVNALMLVRMVA